MKPIITLEEGEKILWRGKPTQRAWIYIMTSPFIPLLLITLLNFILLIPTYLNLLQSEDKYAGRSILNFSLDSFASWGYTMLSIAAVLYLIGLILIVVSIIIFVHFQKKIEYVVTNHRIFTEFKEADGKPMKTHWYNKFSDGIRMENIRGVVVNRFLCKEGEENVKILYRVNTFLGNINVGATMPGMTNAEDMVRIINEQIKL